MTLHHLDSPPSTSIQTTPLKRLKPGLRKNPIKVTCAKTLLGIINVLSLSSMAFPALWHTT